MKKTIIFLMLLISLSPLCYAYWGFWEQERGVLIQLPNFEYYQDAGITFSFTYILYNSSMWLDEFYYDYSLTEYSNAVSYLVNTPYTYGRSETDGTSLPEYWELPYTIYSCFMYCDADKSSPDYMHYMTHYGDLPYTTDTFYNTHYQCNYGDSYYGTNVTARIGCVLVMNEHYEGYGGWYRSLMGYDENITDFIYGAGFTDGNVRNMCETSTGCFCTLPGGCENGYGIYCDDTGSTQWGTEYMTCSNVIVESFDVTFQINNEGERLSEGTASVGNTSYEGATAGTDLGGEPDGDQLNKIVVYNDLADDVRKSNIAIMSMIYIMELVFSIVLMFFYLIELALTIYVFTIWIPGVLHAVVDIFRRIGGV